MAKERVKIKLLGGFGISKGDKQILTRIQQSKKTRELIQFLILKQGKCAMHEELINNLWNGNSNASTALRTLMHRYRAAVDSCGIPVLQNSVLTCRGGYRWNTDLDIDIDVYEFERLVKRADGASPQRKRKLLLGAVELYTGPLLPTSDDGFTIGRRAYYRELYLGALYELIALLKTDSDYDEIVRLTGSANQLEPMEERIRAEHALAMMHARSANSRPETAAAFSEMSEKALSAYERAMLLYSRAEQDVARIKNYLNSAGNLHGPYECSYAEFSSIFQLQRRILQRYNTTMFLALIFLSDGVGSPPDGGHAETMAILRQVLKDNLRHGDTMAKSGDVQYALLLPATSYKTAGAVMERIKNRFYEQVRDLSLTYRISPLELHDPAE